MIINETNYTSSNECVQISQEHVIFNMTFCENFSTVIFTANAIFNKQLDADIAISFKVNINDLGLSNDDLKKLSSYEAECCRKRACFVFGVEYVKATNNVFNF